jgi:glycine oxidase
LFGVNKVLAHAALWYNYTMRTGGEVVILGGGVIGLTAAYFLAREGVPVRVLDRGPVGREASWAGAGILPPSHWPAAHHPFDRLRALSGQLFPDLSEELRAVGGIDNGFVRCGGLEFTSHHGDADEQEWAGEGIPAETLDEAMALGLEPALAPGLGKAVYLPTLAQLRNPRHLQALRTACLHTGKVRLEEGCDAREFRRQGGRVAAVATSAGLVEGDAFLIATGSWADELLRPLEWSAGICPVRGQIALLNPGRTLFRRVLIWGARYLVPRLDGRVLAGSTEERTGYVKQTTVQGIQELLHLAVSLVPALAGAEVERCWAGLRPGSPDGLPFIGGVPGTDNVYVAAGHFRAGIQLSPGTALLIKELILGKPLTMPLEAFRLERVNGLR